MGGLAPLGAKNTFGATLGMALGNIAVPEWMKSPSMPKRANLVLAVVTNAKSLTSIVQLLALLSFSIKKAVSYYWDYCGTAHKNRVSSSSLVQIGYLALTFGLLSTGLNSF